LQTKLDAITEDSTARFMAKVARDMVQAGQQAVASSMAIIDVIIQI
jgi:hypothetical protein